MTEAEFWLIIRRALLMIVAAIEKKYAKRNGQVVEPTGTDTVATWTNYRRDEE
jgi:hypothetical protein